MRWPWQKKRSKPKKVVASTSFDEVVENLKADLSAEGFEGFKISHVPDPPTHGHHRRRARG